MDFALAIGCAVAVIVIALVLGWSQANVKSRTAKAFIWIGSILLLLAIRWWDGLPLVIVGLALVTVWQGLERIPSWLVYTVLALGFCFAVRYILSLIVESIADLSREIEKTNARIELLENSLRDKLDDISSQLPQRDEPDYLTELRKQKLRD
jgi:multisubunit Na+/H+ antiporter MnhB subunit